MNCSLEPKIKTLTPIWTGNVDMDSGVSHETGILGSLRWWYELLIKELNGNTCGPSEVGCQFDTTAYKNSLKQGKRMKEAIEQGLKEVCPVCQLFGCTGWSRRFQLKIENLNTIPLFFVSHKTVYVNNGGWLSRIFGGKRERLRGRNIRFYFDKKTLWNEKGFTLKIIFARKDDKLKAILSFLLNFISIYGGLGAKTQNGFGQIKIIEGLDEDVIQEGKKIIIEKAHSFCGSGNPEHSVFSKGRFFSLIFEIRDRNPYKGVERTIGIPPQQFDYHNYFIPCAFDIRYKIRSRNPFTQQGQNFGMRPFLKNKFGKNIANLLLGKSQAKSDEEKEASRINVSHLYKEDTNGPFYLKIWGYIPPIERPSIDEIIGAIKDYINDSRVFPGSVIVKEFKREEVLE